MKNPTMTLLNATPKGNAIERAKNMPAVPLIKPRVDKPKISKFQQEYLDKIYSNQVIDTLRTNVAPAAIDIEDYANSLTGNTILDNALL